MHTVRMETILHRAADRGLANHGWLKSHHSFNFGHFYHPDRKRFGALRVLNDDTVAPGRGFRMHPHQNMEIVTIMLSGVLAHRDSMGNENSIRAGEIQAMSAGSGVMHSEYNGSDDEPVAFLQIWILPQHLGIEPRYGQKSFLDSMRVNQTRLVVSPDGESGSLAVDQETWFHLVSLDAGGAITYATRSTGNGTYIFVIEGEISASGERLSRRDALGIWDTESFDLSSPGAAELLLIEVPMI